MHEKMVTIQPLREHLPGRIVGNSGLLARAFPEEDRLNHYKKSLKAQRLLREAHTIEPALRKIHAAGSISSARPAFVG